MKKYFLIISMIIGSACYGQYDTLTLDFYGGKPTDTINRCYVEVDSFLIQYKHSGNYFSDLVGRMIAVPDSTIPDSVRSKANPSDPTTWEGYIWREDTAAYRRHRHYYSHIQCYSIKNGQQTLLGKEMFGYYVEAGCYEDVPKCWIDRAKKENKP